MDTQHHSHRHEAAPISSLNTAFKLGIALNTAYVVIEAVCGLVYKSMGLLSDAGHNLSDVAALVVAMIAYKLSTRKPSASHTYGYKKLTIQASLFNALLLCVAVGAILFESVNKLLHPSAVDGSAIAWVAAAGVLINGITAWLFVKDKGRDLNVRGAYLHMAADTLVSVGVVVSGIVIHFTGCYVIDPVIGIVIALVVGYSTKGLLRESMRLSIDCVPRGIDMERLQKALEAVPGVRSIHHIHVWAISTTENAMTVHAVIDSLDNLGPIISQMKNVARGSGIAHSTIEAEPPLECDNEEMFNPD